MNLEQLTTLIKEWAIDKGLDKADPAKQMNKVTEEIGELAAGVARSNTDKIIDSIGDGYVTLVILSMQYGLNIESCIGAAYHEIKDRKGKTVNGTFIKESDL
jgi:NTP pyrophosphatase (non-canonical NTP hydrolase)